MWHYMTSASIHVHCRFLNLFKKRSLGPYWSVKTWPFSHFYTNWWWASWQCACTLMMVSSACALMMVSKVTVCMCPHDGERGMMVSKVTVCMCPHDGEQGMTVSKVTVCMCPHDGEPRWQCACALMIERKVCCWARWPCAMCPLMLVSKVTVCMCPHDGEQGDMTVCMCHHGGEQGDSVHVTL